ncbi:MAG TPA: branched-chain amino acid ABC transporter permease, partial [bacterium]|nr:branched-chain amino acid ABC transporter permease [bacterium]
MGFYADLLVNGLLTGLLYSLIALGFVLIYKASDV